MKNKTNFFFFDTDKESNSKYYANHCECGEMFLDEDLFHPSESAFVPTQLISCKGITIEEIFDEYSEQEFKLNCSFPSSDLIWEYAKRINF